MEPSESSQVLLCGLAVVRTVRWRSSGRAELSGSLRLAIRLASAAEGNWRGGRGRTSVFVGAIGLGTIVGVSRRLSENMDPSLETVGPGNV